MFSRLCISLLIHVTLMSLRLQHSFLHITPTRLCLSDSNTLSYTSRQHVYVSQTPTLFPTHHANTHHICCRLCGCILIVLPPQMMGALWQWWPLSTLSVSLSVCPVPGPKSRTKERRKLKIVSKEDHETGHPWPHLPVERSNTCRERTILVSHWACEFYRDVDVQ